MSGKKSHVRGETKGDFCATAVSGGKCTHKGGKAGNNFRKTGAPKWEKQKNPFQAHHLLPVRCITSKIIGVEKLKGIIHDTKWCINDEDNMYGMPTWGKTVMYYCSVSAVTAKWKAQEVGPPDWEKIPQHLQDHNLYDKEVALHLEELVCQWEEDDHDVQADDLRAALLTWSGLMHEFLVERGTRRDGTHLCWQGALKDPKHPGWYEPFSMAETPRVQSFPLRVNAGADWVKWYKNLTGKK